MRLASSTAVDTGSAGVRECALVTFMDEKSVSEDKCFPRAASSWWELVSPERDSLGAAKKL